MEILSRHVADVAGGVELHTTLDGESISAYVVMGVTDLDAIADIVPPKKSKAERTYTPPVSTMLIMRKTKSTRSWKISIPATWRFSFARVPMLLARRSICWVYLSTSKPGGKPKCSPKRRMGSMRVWRQGI